MASRPRSADSFPPPQIDILVVSLTFALAFRDLMTYKHPMRHFLISSLPPAAYCGFKTCDHSTGKFLLKTGVRGDGVLSRIS